MGSLHLLVQMTHPHSSGRGQKWTLNSVSGNWYRTGLPLHQPRVRWVLTAQRPGINIHGWAFQFLKSLVNLVDTSINAISFTHFSYFFIVCTYVLALCAQFWEALSSFMVFVLARCMTVVPSDVLWAPASLISPMLLVTVTHTLTALCDSVSFEKH